MYIVGENHGYHPQKMKCVIQCLLGYATIIPNSLSSTTPSPFTPPPN